MTWLPHIGTVAILASFVTKSYAQRFPKEDLILCDCGIGSLPDQPKWSTSRQMNWYEDITWPDSASAYPNAPDMSVEVPYKDGRYPWVPEGVTATMPNGDVWSVYIEDGTPDGFQAGTAVTTKEGGQKLKCWAYRDRSVSAAINETVSKDSGCRSAFVCNRDDSPPPWPKEDGSQTSQITSSAAPTTSYFSETAHIPVPTATDSTQSGQPVPTNAPKPGALEVAVSVSPRFINWQSSWESFINNIVWDQSSGNCVSNPINSVLYNITFSCAGVQVDKDTHMTLLLIQALKNVGLKSLWFNPNPVIPGDNSTRPGTSEWVVMPEAFTIHVIDPAAQNTVGYISYTAKHDGFLTDPCSICDTSRFNKNFFDPIIAAMQGSYPVYSSYTVQAQCDPWIVCK